MVDNVKSSNTWDTVYRSDTSDGGVAIAMPSTAPAPGKQGGKVSGQQEVSKGLSGDISMSKSEDQSGYEAQAVDVQMDPPRKASLIAHDPAVREKMQKESANLEKGSERVASAKPEQGYINSETVHIGDGSGLMSMVSVMMDETYSNTRNQIASDPSTTALALSDARGEEVAESNRTFTKFKSNPWKAFTGRVGWLFDMTGAVLEKTNTKVERDLISVFQPSRLKEYEEENEIFSHSEIWEDINNRKRILLDQMRKDFKNYRNLSPEEQEAAKEELRAMTVELQVLTVELENSGNLSPEDRLLIEETRGLLNVLKNFDYDLGVVYLFFMENMGVNLQEDEDEDEDEDGSGLYAILEDARRVRHESERLDKADREREGINSEVENRRIEAEESVTEQQPPSGNPLFTQQAANIPEIVPVERVAETNVEQEEPLLVIAGGNQFRVKGAYSDQSPLDSVPDLNPDSIGLLPDSDHNDLAMVFMPEDTSVLDQLLSALDEGKTDAIAEKVPFDEGLAIAVKLEAWQQTETGESDQAVFELKANSEMGQDSKQPSVADFLAEIKDVPLKVADHQQEQQELEAMVLRSSFV